MSMCCVGSREMRVIAYAAFALTLLSCSANEIPNSGTFELELEAVYPD